MFELSLNNIKKYMDATLILENISFQIYSGEKVGIVGANGSGKTTILKLIAGILKLNCYPGSKSLGYDEGWIAMPREASVAYLDQIPEYPEHYTVNDVLNLAFESLFDLEAKMRDMELLMKHTEGVELERLLKKYGDLMHQFEIGGGYQMREKLNKVCVGLGFTEAFLKSSFALLSGGEKTTVVLGKLLIDNPDILLLDEPTNHLDMDAIDWLENYLTNYDGIVIVVSHDRYFLDNVVTKIVELEDMGCATYKGNYSEYMKQKEEQMLIQFADFKEQQKKIEAMEKTIKELRDWAIRADNNKFFKRAASIQIKLDKMVRIEKPVFDKTNMKIDLKVKQRSGNETIKVVGLHKSYDEKKLFNDADMMVYYGERVALIGPNGSGKTTLLKMLLGTETPDAGHLSLGANVMAAYLPQKIVFDNEEFTVVESLRDNLDLSEGKAREYLSKFMFCGSTVFKKVRHLSGGERIRLKLARLLYDDVNLLILDEPTNHLDIDSIETFEEALEAFRGTVFFISHDRYFINKISERVIAIENQKLNSYDGNYNQYKLEQDKLKMIEALKVEAATKSSTKPSMKQEAKPSTYKKSNTNKVVVQQLDSSKLEKIIIDLEYELCAIDREMAENAMNHTNLNELYNKRIAINSKLESTMEMWMSLSTEVE